MYVSFDFEVTGDVTPEEAVAACREYISSFRAVPNHKYEFTRHSQEEKITAHVTQTLVRAGYQPAALPGEVE